MVRLYLLLMLSVLALLSVDRAQAEDRKLLPSFPTVALLSADDRKHLLTDDFTVVRTVREIPAPIRHLLIPNARTISSGMADAGQEFRATDVVIKELPRRRLVLAAVNARYCLVYIEQGGRGYNQHVTLFRLQNGHATRVWGDYLFARPPLTFSELRAALRNSGH